jgi:3alpha(or 20beta)-hydroxysteroid dehydrogenase
MGELDGRVALVTGAARGLGAAVVEIFLREGAKVVFTDVLAADGARLAQQLGTNTRFLEHDVTNEIHWASAVQHARHEFGRLDILVNNAGLPGVHDFDSTTPELWDHLIRVMQTGPYLGLRAAIPALLAAGGGSVVNIASTNALRGMSETSAYTAAKHGLLGLTRSMALEFAPRGIRINAVCPGPMRTRMLVESFGEDRMEGFAKYVPAGRLADPHEVGEVVCFLASSRASFCVGATFVVDGGLTVG